MATTIGEKTKVIITGASSGIGAALAQLCGEKGASVALVARRLDRLQNVAEKIREAGGKAFPIVADVTNFQQITDALKDVLEQWGSVDVLVNNAGRGYCALVEETTPEQLERIFALNAFALWYTTGVVLPVMKQKNSGTIVNVASVAGKIGYPINSAYVAAKHACVGFTAALRTELVGTNIDAFVVCPAAVDTEWPHVTEQCPLGEIYTDGIRRSKEIAQKYALPLAPLAPVLTAEEVAAMIMRAIENPPDSDLFTHPGTEELAFATAFNRKKAEKLMFPFYLGVLEAYADYKKRE